MVESEGRRHRLHCVPGTGRERWALKGVKLEDSGWGSGANGEWARVSRQEQAGAPAPYSSRPPPSSRPAAE